MLQLRNCIYKHKFVFIRNDNCLISSCRRDKILHLCNCVYECCNYAMTPHLVSSTRRDKAITQLRNYAIVNTNEYECIRSQHKFVFIRNDNCLISSCQRDKMRRKFRGVISEALSLLVEETR
jgi:hypothetical protein